MTFLDGTRSLRKRLTPTASVAAVEAFVGVEAMWLAACSSGSGTSSSAAIPLARASSTGALK